MQQYHIHLELLDEPVSFLQNRSSALKITVITHFLYEGTLWISMRTLSLPGGWSFYTLV